MTSENIMKERWDQLGLPPMELAESSENCTRDNSGLYKCLLPSLHKLVMMLLLTTFGVGTYVLLSRLSDTYDNAGKPEVIILTGNNEIPNVTVYNMEIFLQLKNETADQRLISEQKAKRKKRHTNTPAVSPTEIDDTVILDDEQLQKAREIILKHDVICNNEEKQEICKDFVKKLKAIVENNDESKAKENPSRIKLKVNDENIDDGKTRQNDVAPTDLTKREALPNMNLDSILESVPAMHMEARDAIPYTNPDVLPHSHSVSPQHLSETCLLARMLKQKYPRAKGVYDPSPEYLAPHYEQHPLLPQSRYFSPAMHAPYLQERDMDLQSHKVHPQDVDIFLNFLTSKSEPTVKARASNSSRETACPSGTLPCRSGDACVDEKQWCDGNVDCIDVSDEARCTCKQRVDKSRLCDGYFDCPFGEDEMGCYGCSETMFSCQDLDMNSHSTCFTKEQRCNNVVDCPNHKDEVECNMLAPSLLKKPLFAISNTEGFLHRNFKGDWYAVCKNPYMWAHDACRRETGLIIRPPFIQIVPIDPMMKIDYLNTGPGGLIQTSDTCMNSSAVYVTCPDLLCGTRVQSTSKLLRENAAIESHLFGRNKRFLLKNHPYPLMFYGNRLKRDVDDTNTKTNYEIKFNRSKRDYFDTMRNKRTESRVVGGNPSQPAAWPWMVAVYRNGMFHCGGVVITHSWVVSAAHCVHKFWDHYYEVQVGMLRRFSFSPQEQSHKVTHVIVNPHYSQTDMKNDLSLLKVEPAIQFSRWVRPICLPGPDTAGPDWLWGPSPGTICTSVGWGATTEHGPDPDHMREVEVPIWANCKHREDRAGNEICAGLVEGGRDACQGDSGGPLLCRNPLNSKQWFMAGIVSHGDGCARKDEPGVYTRVSLFVKWIKYHISSKTLPKFQPLQECPGFKCETGISKCLPTKRRCDKIVDCLNGEDETKCEFTETVSKLADSIFVDPKSSLEELLESKEVQTEPTLSSSSNKNQEDATPSKMPPNYDTSTPRSKNEKTIDSTDNNNTSDRISENLDLQSEESSNNEKQDDLNAANPINPTQSKESTDAEKVDSENEENPFDNKQSKESTDAEKNYFKNEENPIDNIQSKELTDAEKLDVTNEKNSFDQAQSKESTNAEKRNSENEENPIGNIQSKESTNTEKLNSENEENPFDATQTKESTDAEKLNPDNDENPFDHTQSKESTETEKLNPDNDENPFDNTQTEESTDDEKEGVTNEENSFDHTQTKESTDAKKLKSENEENPLDHTQSKESTDTEKLNADNDENTFDNTQTKESTDDEKLDVTNEENSFDHTQSKELTDTEKRNSENEENPIGNIQSKESTDTEKLNSENEENPFDDTQTKESTHAEKQKSENEENPLDHTQSKESTDTEKLNSDIEENPFDRIQSNESTDTEKLDSENKGNPIAHLQSEASTDNEKLASKNAGNPAENIDRDIEKQDSEHENKLSDHSQPNKSTDAKKPDFEHASTLEITNESPESFFIARETATVDPKSSTIPETTSPNRGDAEMITMDFSSESLESGSLKQLKERMIHLLTEADNMDNDSFEDIKKTENVLENKLETSTSAFTHNDVIESMEKNEPTTPINRMENLQENNDDDKAENKSGLVIGLLPNSSTVPDQEATETKLIDNENDVTLSHDHKDSSTEKLPDFKDKSETLNQIEDIVFSELEPAKIRRKHRIPKEFECRRIEQTIPYQNRCDRKAHCEDGTDELDCTCTDFLFTFDEKLICDGVIDCADGQDESDCFSCPEDHFLCKRSRICLPEKHVCDGKAECPQGEDELNCFALTNGKEMEFDLEERPIVNLQGYLTKRQFNDWHVVCDDQLSPEQQEEAATHICRYLGFSSANNYNVKYINLKEERKNHEKDEITERSLDNKRTRRDTMKRVPIHFAYRHEIEENDKARHTIIKEPQVIKEQCVPNITKTCKSLYVFCDDSLFTNFDDSDNNMFLRETESVSNHTWPWIAKVFVEGDYRCTGVLVNLTWVLVSDSCLWDSTLSHHYITVVLGSHRTLGGMNGLHEQVYQVDSKKDVYRSKAALLHLREPAHYSNVVKPMVVSSAYSLEQKSSCVAVGQDDKNNTISVFLEETSENCHPSNRCFKRKSTDNICPLDVTSHRHWAGVVSCHTEQGWYPAATFVDGRGECGLGDHINATDIENLKNEIKYHYGKKTLPSLIDKDYGDDCAGVRCSRGRCVPLLQVCNGVRDCEDGKDEAEGACEKKNKMCDKDPYHKGCECSVGQMKCHNGKCISKELFRDGNDDCGDGTDEPGQTICKDYLATVMPSRLCDGILHCHDRSDEDPVFCKCFAKKNYKCGSQSGVDHCVAPDTVCDGVRDCPNGEDEQTCMALNAPHGTPYGTGQVIVRSHGVWHSKCYASQNHTKSELEAICSELGFFSGHAKQIKEMDNFVVHPYNNLVVDPFNEIILNNNTVIKMRNTHEPLAKAVFDEQLQNCYPVFIECR